MPTGAIATSNSGTASSGSVQITANGTASGIHSNGGIVSDNTGSGPAGIITLNSQGVGAAGIEVDGNISAAGSGTAANVTLSENSTSAWNINLGNVTPVANAISGNITGAAILLTNTNAGAITFGTANANSVSGSTITVVAGTTGGSGFGGTIRSHGQHPSAWFNRST